MDSAISQTVTFRTSAGSALVPTLSLSARNVPLGEARPLPLSVLSPINVDVLEFYLRECPCRSTVGFVLEGFRAGFDIGFDGPVSASRPNNLLLARRNPGPVSAAIEKEILRGHSSGPFVSPPLDLGFICFTIGSSSEASRILECIFVSYLGRLGRLRKAFQVFQVESRNTW